MSLFCFLSLQTVFGKASERTLKQPNPLLKGVIKMKEDKDYIVIINGSIPIDVNANSKLNAVKGAISYFESNFEHMDINTITVC